MGCRHGGVVDGGLGKRTSGGRASDYSLALTRYSPHEAQSSMGMVCVRQLADLDGKYVIACRQGTGKRLIDRALHNVRNVLPFCACAGKVSMAGLKTPKLNAAPMSVPIQPGITLSVKSPFTTNGASKPALTIGMTAGPADCRGHTN